LQEQAVVATPLSDRLQGVAIAQQRGHKAREQVREIIALSMFGTRVGDGGKGFIQAHQGGIGLQALLLVRAQRRQRHS